MTEYLAIRSEMTDLIKLNFNLILAALTVAAGTAVAAATNTGHWPDDVRGFLLMLAAGFGLLIFLAAVGILNSFKVLEWYASKKATAIARRSERLHQGDALATLPEAVRRFSTVDPRRRGPLVALALSYGVVPAVGLVVWALLLVIAVAGYLTGSSSSGGLSGWLGPLLIGDVALAVVAIIALVITIRLTNEWPKIMED
jgi:hypothetical protein